MRWFIIAIVALTSLSVGLTFGQRTQNEDVAQKFESLERRLAEAERKIVELEKKVADLRSQVSQISLMQRFTIVPHPSPVLPFRWQIPEEMKGFGLPKPAPVPFVQPYYYPLEKRP